MKIRRYSPGRRYKGPYGIGVVLQEEEYNSVQLSTVKHSDRNSTLGQGLTQNEKNAFKEKIKQLRQENQRKIRHPVIWTTLAMSAIAISIVLFMIAGMTGHQGTSPFAVFEIFRLPYVSVSCISFLIGIIVILSIRSKIKHKNHNTPQIDSWT